MVAGSGTLNRLPSIPPSTDFAVYPAGSLKIGPRNCVVAVNSTPSVPEVPFPKTLVLSDERSSKLTGVFSGTLTVPVVKVPPKGPLAAGLAVLLNLQNNRRYPRSLTIPNLFVYLPCRSDRSHCKFLQIEKWFCLTYESRM